MRVLKHQHGFTLMEAIIVVCIIIIGAWVLFPIFTRKIRYHHTPSCQNNLKQYGHALDMYLEDNSRRYPTRYIGDTPQANDPHKNPSHPGWIHNAVQSYLKNPSVMECPELPSKEGVWHAKEYSSSYAYNYTLLTDLKEKLLEEPADMLVMWDSTNNYFDEQANVGWSETTRTHLTTSTVNQKAAVNALLSPGGDVYNFCGKEGVSCVYRWQTPPDKNAANCVMWHTNRADCLWADGHVSVSNFERFRWNQLLMMKKDKPCFDQPVSKCDPVKTH